jgi:DNA invertase Pin-like site-specific DNA recombinase
VTLEDLDVEIHLAKEGQVISKESKSQAKVVHGMMVVLARNYLDNLSEEVIKGMREKAEQGIYPGGRPRLGYRFNKVNHCLEVNPESSHVVERMFELYATGAHSLKSLRNLLRRNLARCVPSRN